tara:strand:- start:940 stop:1074 length:135 start_codon:yes stop_codon:yes gene_type:complete
MDSKAREMLQKIKTILQENKKLLDDLVEDCGLVDNEEQTNKGEV